MPNKNNIKILNYFVIFFNESFQFDIYVNGQSGLFVYREIPAPGEKQATPVLKVKRSDCAIFIIHNM